MIRNLTALILVVLLLTTQVICLADDGAIGKTPDGVFPINNTDIVMIAEDIHVNLDDGKVTCNFEFKNTDKVAKKILMGFPAEWDDSSEQAKNFLNYKMVFDNFKTFIAGKEIKVKKEKGLISKYNSPQGIGYKSWFTFIVPFKAGQQIKIKNTYKTNPASDSIGDIFYGYILKTGASWKGNIGKAKVTFSLGEIKPYEIIEINPKEMKFEGNNIVWQKDDFEPTFDLNITYNRYKFSNEFLKNVNSETADNTKIKNLYSKVVKSKDLKQLKQYYNEALAFKNQGMILYIKSKLDVNNYGK